MNFHETKTDSENRLLVAKGDGDWGRNGLGVWDHQEQTSMYKMDKQWIPTVYHKKLYSISYHKP